MRRYRRYESISDVIVRGEEGGEGGRRGEGGEGGRGEEEGGGEEHCDMHYKHEIITSLLTSSSSSQHRIFIPS